MNNRITNVPYEDRIIFPISRNSMREMNSSHLHRINQFQSNNNNNNNPFLYQEFFNSNASLSVASGRSRTTFEDQILDSTNLPKSLYNNSRNHKSMLNQCLENPANILPYIYPNMSTDNVTYHSNIHQKRQLSPQTHYFNKIDHSNTNNTSSKRSRSNSTRSTQSWTCLCTHPLDEINEYRKTPIKHNILKDFNDDDDNDSIQNSGNFQRIHVTNDHHHHLTSHDNLMNLSLTSSLSSSTSIPASSSSPSFECARSFIRLRNARERERVRCVNAGYESLRRHLPLTVLPDRRLAKVEILRGAINYINTLKELLEK